MSFHAYNISYETCPLHNFVPSYNHHDLQIKCFIYTDSKSGSHFSAEKDEWGADHSSEIHIVGRIVLNLWRLLRHEVSLMSKHVENKMFQNTCR